MQATRDLRQGEAENPWLPREYRLRPHRRERALAHRGEHRQRTCLRCFARCCPQGGGLLSLAWQPSLGVQAQPGQPWRVLTDLWLCCRRNARGRRGRLSMDEPLATAASR